ncbi:hypothetical protein UFOVP61_11 [uncultured Caudovirales phage]|uniref:Uncharacterized protein n=1 Tax=uncultured Caudovirales phage TaxID=2100421 RepID=A0A6J5KW73_9CAUD|nr:hypothetical protein UFOVP61_11 [uncultured Caudovirales phage]
MTYKMVFVNETGKRIGEDHHRAKLSNADVDLVFYLREAGLSYQQIADKFDDIPGGVSKSTVRDVLSGRRRGQIPHATKRVLVRSLDLCWGVAHPEEFPLL